MNDVETADLALKIIWKVRDNPSVRMEFAKLLRTFFAESTLTSYENRILRAEEIKNKEVNEAEEKFERVKAAKSPSKGFKVARPIDPCDDDDYEETV